MMKIEIIKNPIKREIVAITTFSEDELLNSSVMRDAIMSRFIEKVASDLALNLQNEILENIEGEKLTEMVSAKIAELIVEEIFTRLNLKK